MKDNIEIILMNIILIKPICFSITSVRDIEYNPEFCSRRVGSSLRVYIQVFMEGFFLCYTRR